MYRIFILGIFALTICASAEARSEMAGSQSVRNTATVLTGQRGNGKAYEIAGTQVWDVADPKSGRKYQVFVALPKSYPDKPEHRYPVLYVTDADYGFPVVRQVARRLSVDGQKLQEFILVGLSYAIGEESMQSRRRDYTPSSAGAHDAPSDAVHGESGNYIHYLRTTLFPFIAKEYRTDEDRRMFLGHSYGGLLGLDILFKAPEMFSGYVIGSPSLWYDNKMMEGVEKKFSRSHHDIAAKV